MNCASTRNHILALEDPAQLPPEFTGHIAGCDGCRVWHRNLLRIEKSIPLVPMPAGNASVKAEFLLNLRTPQTRSAQNNHKPVARERPLRTRNRLSPQELMQYWPAGLIAATLLIGTIAWLTLRGGGPTPGISSPPDPMLEVVVNANLELAKAKTPEKRIEALKKLADQLHQEMRDICRVDPSGENMNELQSMYRDVVLRGILLQARPQLLNGTAAEKKTELEKLEKWLSEAGRQAEQLAAEVPQSSVGSLKEVAEVARQGTKRIREEYMRGI